MNSSNKEKLLFKYLLNKSMDGQITLSEIRQLNTLLETCPDLEGYYIDNVLLQYLLAEAQIANDLDVNAGPVLPNEILTELLLPEEKSPAGEMSKEKSKQELFQQYVPNDRLNKHGKLPLLSICSSAAAILLIILGVNLGLKHLGGPVMATLVDQINVQWSQSDSAMKPGKRLRLNHRPLHLEKGIVKVRYDDGVDVLIEGPAEFEIEPKGIILNYGSLFSWVSEPGVGFTVHTPATRYVDLGTEFGVKCSMDGSSELHVFKGKVQIVASSNGKPQAGQIITENKAVRHSAGDNRIETIPFGKKNFVRQVNSKAGVIWRGQNYIDLADIAGGGNGFGTGEINKGIDPFTGLPAGELLENRIESNEYHRVPSNPYIDGVFIPDGDGQNGQVISSLGHVFQECPVSNGSSYNNLLNVRRPIDLQSIQNSTRQGTQTAACVLLHANMGITYDLQALRRLLPGATIVRFQSMAGIEKGAIRPEVINADFWVLVDGQLKFKKTQVKNRILFPVDIKLSAEDRYLTLVTTDGGDPEGRIVDNLTLSTIDSDWCMFVNPVLVLN